jgi:hypothetical protein
MVMINLRFEKLLEEALNENSGFKRTVHWIQVPWTVIVDKSKTVKGLIVP